MRFSRTIVTVLGLALAWMTAVTDFGETPADATSSAPRPAAHTEAAPPTGPSPPGRPDTILGIVNGEAGAGTQVFEFDTAGHDSVRVVAEVPEGEIVDVERAPDGTVYYAFVIGETNEIRRLVRSAEEGEKVVAHGWAPAVSPDGRWLAYAYYPDNAGPCGRDGIAVLEIATGDIRRFPGPAVTAGPAGCPDSEGVIHTISWAPDSRRLVYEEGATDPRILDTATDRQLVDGHLLDARFAYYHPAWHADGRIAVAERADASGIRILVVDPDTR
jgi:Tol biopolymer transport system component